MSSRRAFVTGGSGFIGSAIVRALVDEGTAVRALVRASSPRDNLEGLPVELIEGDLADLGALQRGLEGCDEVSGAGTLAGQGQYQQSGSRLGGARGRGGSGGPRAARSGGFRKEEEG